jgi:transcriptional regulator with XRE-family HTH domain
MRARKTQATIRQAYLSRALKALRRRRGVRVAFLAKAIGMPVRTYQNFEAGRTRINVERVHAIAEILDADAAAIFAAVELASPEFAVRAADNKLVTAFLLSLKDFDARSGDQITHLDARTLMSAFDQMFGELAQIAKARAEAACRWRGPRDPDDDDEP